MIEEKVCFLLVSVARPSVSLTTTGGGKQRVEEQGKKRSRGQRLERNEKRFKEADSNPTKGEVKKKRCGQMAGSSAGNLQENFRPGSCFSCQPASRGREKVLQHCEHINMWGRKRRRRRSSVCVHRGKMAPLHQSSLSLCLPSLTLI